MRFIEFIFALIFCALVTAIPQKTENGCKVNLYQVGDCDPNQVQHVLNAANQTCQQYPNDVVNYAMVLQYTLDPAKFSVFAVYQESGIGYTICISKPCYLSFGIGTYGLVGVFIGGPGPCDANGLRFLTF